MADTAIAITAGTGTNVDTRTESTNNNHRQVVVIGDPSTNAGVAPVDATNGLKVDGSGVTLTVGSHNVTNAGTFAVQASDGGGSLTVDNAGTFAVQAAQSGTWTVQPGNTANTTAWKVDGSAVTQPVSISGNQAVNVAQIAGTTTAVNTGTMNNGTMRVAIASDSPGVIATATPGTLSSAGISATVVNPSNYETVAASQTAQVMGSTGATGDYFQGILVVPATTSPGNVIILDNATSITVFTGGATSVSNLVPFFIPLGMTSVSGAWKVTTGANVSVISVGKFT